MYSPRSCSPIGWASLSGRCDVTDSTNEINDCRLADAAVAEKHHRKSHVVRQYTLPINNSKSDFEDLKKLTDHMHFVLDYFLRVPVLFTQVIHFLLWIFVSVIIVTRATVRYLNGSNIQWRYSWDSSHISINCFFRLPPHFSPVHFARKWAGSIGVSKQAMLQNLAFPPSAGDPSETASPMECWS
jgi:hypothetical protein